MSQPENRSNDRFNTILATVVGQVGCLTPLILLGALFAGLWLDRQFDTKPLFTILFIIGSAPFSVFVIYRIVRMATAKLKTDNQDKKTEEEAKRE
ncbi:MAG: AtpZ/AtpI family protein [Anaerolineales bacterium]|jgi:F0F1-type ATP synthase assembly protein I